ncbi:MAG: hypothetical protein AAFR93_03910 [Pseudomonadota bacterium]
MAKPTLILHAGLQKTGTTAIQNALAGDRARLAGHGVHYPAVPRLTKGPYANHLALFRRLAARDFVSRARAQRALARLPQDTPVVLSAENVCRLALPGQGTLRARQLLFLQRIHDLLPHHKVTPLLYLRRPDAFAQALYKEAVARGQQSAKAGFADFIARQDARFDFPALLQRFEAAFGMVSAVGYEAASETGLLDDFYGRIRVPAPGQDGGARARRSLSGQGMIWLRQHLIKRRAGHRARVLFATREVGAQVLAQRPGGGLWPDRASFDAFCERHRASFDLPMCEAQPGPWQNPAPTWSPEDHAQVDQAFLSWRAENAGLLRKRARLRLAFHEPDPV